MPLPNDRWKRKTVNEGPVRLKLHAGQARVWNSPARFPAAIAGTGGGKSFLLAPWLLREIGLRTAQAHATEAEGVGTYLAVGPTWRMVKRIIVPNLITYAKRLRVFDNYRRADNEIHLTTGDIIYLGSAENPWSLEGVHCYGGAGDEPGQWSLEAWEVVQRRMGIRKGRFLLTTTPYAENWLKTDVIDRAAAGDPNYSVSTWPSWWNPEYDYEEYQRAKATLPAWRFDMFYNGIVTRPEGLIYETRYDNLEVDQLPADWESWGSAIGLDLGYNNATAALLGVISPNDVLYVISEHYLRTAGLKEHAGVLEAWRKWRPRNMLGPFYDPSSPQVAHELMSFPAISGWPWTAADNEVLPGILEVTARAKSGRLKFLRGSLPHLRDEWESYRWARRPKNAEPVRDPDTREPIVVKDEPIKVNDHALDALRYMAMGVTTHKTPTIRIL